LGGLTLCPQCEIEERPPALETTEVNFGSQTLNEIRRILIDPTPDAENVNLSIFPNCEPFGNVKRDSIRQHEKQPSRIVATNREITID
jgi:hypothetical protein